MEKKKYKFKYKGSVLGECSECGAYGVMTYHHLLYGSGRREMSDKNDLVKLLCNACHVKLHRHDPKMAEKYKKIGQQMFEENHTREEFMKSFMRNYL